MCAVIGVLFPLVTVATSMIEFGVESRNRADNTTSATELFLSGSLGYSATTFPPVLCTASDEDAGFYSLILPICIIQAVVSSMLILLLWSIHRVSIYRTSNWEWRENNVILKASIHVEFRGLVEPLFGGIKKIYTLLHVQAKNAHSGENRLHTVVNFSPKLSYKLMLFYANGYK